MNPHFTLCSIFLLANAAAEPVRQLERLVVQDRRESGSLTAPSPESSRKELANTPGGTEVVEAERYLTGRSSTMADTFALSPGVVAQPRFGSDEARLSIRGSGIQRTFHGRGIRVMQDGVPLNLADGGFDMQAVDPLAVSHVNIWRGANALAYGASTLGGAIDYRSRTGIGSPGASLRLEAGSFGYLRSRLAGGWNHGAVDAYASFSEQFQDGFREHAEQHGQRLFGNAGWRISDGVETRVYFTVVNTESELPGNLTKAELRRNPKQADNSPSGAVRYDNRRDFQLYRVASKTTLVQGEGTTEFIAAHTYKDLDHPITPFVGVIDQLSNDTLAGITHSRDGSLFSRENHLRSGLLWSYGTTDAATFRNVFGRRGALTADADQTAMNAEVFAENRHVLGGGLSLIAGANYAHNRRKNDQRLGGATYHREYDGFSPKLGLLWEIHDLQVFGNWSRSHEPPSFSETNSSTTANQAQTADTFEIGVRSGNRLPIRWDAAMYASKVDDEFLALNDASGTPLGTINADNTLHQGVECFFEADLLGSSWDDTPDHRLVARSAWTWGRFKFDNDDVYGDNTIAGLPPHLVRGELLWEHSSGWYAGPTFEWVPKQAYVDHRNTLSADPYELLGFKFGRRIDDGLSWFVEAKNLADRTYAATTGVIADAKGADSRNFLPGDGRSVFAGLEWKW